MSASLRDFDHLSDVTLVCEGERFPVHKVSAHTASEWIRTCARCRVVVGERLQRKWLFCIFQAVCLCSFVVSWCVLLCVNDRLIASLHTNTVQCISVLSF